MAHKQAGNTTQFFVLWLGSHWDCTARALQWEMSPSMLLHSLHAWFLLTTAVTLWDCSLSLHWSDKILGSTSLELTVGCTEKCVADFSKALWDFVVLFQSLTCPDPFGSSASRTNNGIHRKPYSSQSYKAYNFVLKFLRVNCKNMIS